MHLLTHLSGVAGSLVALAYARALSVLVPNVRDELMASVGAEASLTHTDLHPSVLWASPDRFAAMAWLHFSRNGGDGSLIHRLLNGELMIETLWE